MWSTTIDLKRSQRFLQTGEEKHTAEICKKKPLSKLWSLVKKGSMTTERQTGRGALNLDVEYHSRSEVEEAGKPTPKEI